jgi:hypothetical protein
MILEVESNDHHPHDETSKRCDNTTRRVVATQLIIALLTVSLFIVGALLYHANQTAHQHRSRRPHSTIRANVGPSQVCHIYVCLCVDEYLETLSNDAAV